MKKAEIPQNPTFKKVFKYDLPISQKRVDIALPKGAKVLTIQVQFGEVRLWALVDPEEEQQERRSFLRVTTGENITANDYKYIGSVQVNDGNFIAHYFEI